MGSLPDLTERTRAPLARAAARTVSDPHRHRAIISQIPVGALCRKEWPWKKTRVPLKIPQAPIRRRDSVASSVGAASVRRLIARQPPKVSKQIVQRFTLLCVSSGLSAMALLPFTAYAGAEAGAMPLALMHMAAAFVAPFSPIILQKTGAGAVTAISNLFLCILLMAHTFDTPLSVLLVLYGMCGATLSPKSLALTAAATSLAQSAGEETRRKIALRRALRGLRAAQDIGLILGSLFLAIALVIWAEDITPLDQITPVPTNITIQKWPPPDGWYLLEDDYEEKTCGSAGCPDTQSLSGIALSALGRKVLLGAWGGLVLSALGLGVYGAASSPSPPPDDPRAVLRDLRALLGAPMGLFIGLQQGFIYTSFIKWYGVCVCGWWCGVRALVGAGALAVVAALTASMAGARGGRGRGALAAGGAAAHASLLLALLRWRAARTDLALPAVAAAAWGACAALWDVLQEGLCIGGPGWRGPWSIVIAARHCGLALACAARALVCARTQLATLGATLLLALATHAALELRTPQIPRARS